MRVLSSSYPARFLHYQYEIYPHVRNWLSPMVLVVTKLCKQFTDRDRVKILIIVYWVDCAL
jgi:hypothetical protein